MKLIADRYRAVRAVGRGGMGTVWLCHDEVLGRDVALKQVGRLPGESVPDTARALREARSSAALSHPNVVSVFDVLETEGELWLVMEYVPSRTLSEILREDGPLPPERAARIGAQVASGLAAAHALGTIHRDVKPGNVLVSERDVAKIGDFGIARTVGDQQLTQTGLITGTPAYFAPELARGEDPGPAGDVWALGATLYAAVEGVPPYPEHRNPIALLQQIAAHDPPPPAHAGVLSQPIARMMDRNPRSRWEMADAAQSLRRIAGGPRPAADESTVLTAAPAIVSGGAAPAVASGDDAPDAVPSATDDRQGRPAVAWVLAFVALAVVAGLGWLLLSSDREAGTFAGDNTPTATAPESPADLEPTGRREPTSEPTAEPDDAEPAQEATEAPEDEPTATRKPTPTEQEPPRSGGAGGRGAVVQRYFGTVPGDTDSGWQMLTPSFQQEVGRTDYEAFWASVSSVQLGTVTPARDSAVDVEITYTFDDGSAYVEQQRIYLARADSGWLIDGDEVLSSRQVSG